MYAIVEAGGHQHKVSKGQVIDIERFDGEPGSTVELERVLLVSDGSAITVGQPLVVGAKVTATVVRELKAPKIIVFKYKPKTRYRKRQGHRQRYTRLRIDDIVGG